MKKFLVSALATFVLVSFGSVLAQVQHNVTVSIPEVVTIRFTEGTSRAPVTTNLDLAFAITGDAADFAGQYGPSNLASRGWTNVQVFQNRESTWSVSVVVSGASADFDWSNITVTPSGVDAIASAFNLAVGGVIATDESPNANARGWNALGFGPGDFELELDGMEAGGNFSATVTYALTAP